MFKPSHIYATQYKSYNACTCSKSMTLKICINSIIITWTYINIRFFLKNKSGQSVTYYWKIQRWNIVWFLYPIITGPEIIFYNSLSNVFGDFYWFSNRTWQCVSVIRKLLIIPKSRNCFIFFYESIYTIYILYFIALFSSRENN